MYRTAQTRQSRDRARERAREAQITRDLEATANKAAEPYWRMCDELDAPFDGDTSTFTHRSRDDREFFTEEDRCLADLEAVEHGFRDRSMGGGA